MNALLLLLQYLPSAVQAGIAVKDIIEQTTGKVIPTNGVEVYAAQAMKTLPGLIATGQDIGEAVTRTAALVRQMQAEGRGPTDQEWADQATRIAALEAQLDQAAKP